MTVPQELPRGQSGELLTKLEAAGLTGPLAQRIISSPTDDLAAEIVALVRRGPSYAKQEIASTYTYPPEYALLSISEQLEAWATRFPKLDQTWAREHGQRWLDDLVKPDWVEGALVLPDWLAIVSEGGSYNDAVVAMLRCISDTRTIRNYLDGALGPEFLLQTERTRALEVRLRAMQQGAFRIIPFQGGMRHRGCSILRASFVIGATDGEAGLGLYHNLGGLLVHPQREARWEQLHADCAGDEYIPSGARVPSRAPIVGWDGDVLRVYARALDDAAPWCGSSSAFVPQS